jgi:hypothetical protein
VSINGERAGLDPQIDEAAAAATFSLIDVPARP